jgi:uncharacterized protein YdiU (UPF0061 family)
MQHRPSTRHADLGPEFFDIVAPAAFPQTILRYRNQAWAARVGLDGLSDEAWLGYFGRFEPLPGSFPQPLALRYHGHQFRSYNPELGDGRGFLYAQLHDLRDGRLLDFGTKGSGTTPWSRTADGRLTLKGGVREVLATSMLEALGVYTSKSFSLIETGEELYRGDEPSPTRASVMVRLSHTHIRIGSFQRLSYLEDKASLLKLLDHAIAVAMPETWREDVGERACAFLGEVCARVARMGAQWMAAGFVHGVLNTDNINITGESFDYGPWRFLPEFDPAFTAAYFDHNGLYAFGRQPDTLLWNLVRLAECLLPFTEKEALEQVLGEFAREFQRVLPRQVVWRLGLTPQGDKADSALTAQIWRYLQTSKVPFEQFFFDLRGGRAGPYATEDFAPVRAALSEYAPAEDARRDHPYFARSAPCTMLVDEVERIWAPIAESDDWSLFSAKLADIAAMAEAYGTTPAPVG